jgi:hypothetical protein
MDTTLLEGAVNPYPILYEPSWTLAELLEVAAVPEVFQYCPYGLWYRNVSLLAMVFQSVRDRKFPVECTGGVTQDAICFS